MAINTADIEAASRGDAGAMRRVLTEMVTSTNTVAKAVGVNTQIPVAGTTSSAVATPTQPSIAVNGVDGHFLVTITPATPTVDNTAAAMPEWFEAGGNDAFFRAGDFRGIRDARRLRGIDVRLNNDGRQNGRVLYQLQSALDLNFNANSSVTDYGTSDTLSYDFTDPVVTKFWRVRSRFEQSDFNDWIYYTNDAIGCGPIGVSSGFLRSTSAAPRGVVNNSNNATVDSIDAGGGIDTIRIYGPGGVGSSFIIYDGQGNQTTVSGGTIAGAAQSTFYQVVWSAATGFRAFPNATQYASSLLDQYFTVSGSLKTVAAGGTGGVSGGGGSTGGGGTISGGGGNKLPQL